MDTAHAITDVVIKFALATLLSGAIGLERERKGRAAGLRTHVLVCLGATLAMVISDALADEWRQSGAQVWLDRGRIAAGILTGVGFLGAGTIINVGGLHRGLTTAAMIWFAATLGIAVGAGYYTVGGVATGFALLVVIGLEWVEDRLPASEQFVLTLEVPHGLHNAAQVAGEIRKEGYGVRLMRVRATASDDHTELTFEISSRTRQTVEHLADMLRGLFPTARRIDCRR